LLANALHFVKEQERVLAQLMLSLKTGATLAIIEYDNLSANPWVPYPVNFARLERLAGKLGLPMPIKLATHPSRYHREMYLASLRIPDLYA
jgi:trans-aconitate methyltransferase